MSFLAAMVWLAATTTAVVVRPVANMYSAPSEAADVVSQAILGTNVQVLEEKAGWARIRTPDDYTGWTERAALKASEKPYASAGRVAAVESLFASLYQEPDLTKRQPLTTVPFETRLEVVSEPAAEDRRWIEVRLPDGRRAWLQRGDVSFDPIRLSAGGAVELARRFVGLPYLWGGSSSFGFDCSGFTGMLLRRRGAVIPRDAGPQMRWGGFVPVERSALQPGDLLFFGASAEKVTHTGMYIGGAEFISATTWRKPIIQVSRLDDPHWAPLLVACRRLK